MRCVFIRKSVVLFAQDACFECAITCGLKSSLDALVK